MICHHCQSLLIGVSYSSQVSNLMKPVLPAAAGKELLDKLPQIRAAAEAAAPGAVAAAVARRVDPFEYDEIALERGAAHLLEETTLIHVVTKKLLCSCDTPLIF